MKGDRILAQLTETLHHFLFSVVELLIVLVELWGVFVIISAILKESYNVLFKYKLDFKQINADNSLNASLASALEVLLIGEVLKTITITDYRNLVIIGVLIFLRMAITLLLFWESSHKVRFGEDHGN